MPYFQIITFGCKVNQCDGAGLAQGLEARGWRPAAAGAAPELVVVNTCTVTARADQQARQAIRRLARLRPGVPLWVTGCYAQRTPGEVAVLPGVVGVVGNCGKGRLAEWAAVDPPPEPLHLAEPFATGDRFHPWPAQAFPGRTRGWLKVQEGCGHGCAYCIVPAVRGPSRSLGPEAVEGALADLAVLGHREVVLTGVDLGQYGQDFTPAGSLSSLVGRLRGQNWPFRVRFSSLEPQEVSPELVRECAAWEAFCPHFHLPLQSGAEPVLRAMGRPYRPEDFRALVSEIKAALPEAALGLDVLVGFPTESARDFEATRAMVEALPVTYLHVFPFSPRPGTPAAQLCPLPGPEVWRRARVMREVGAVKKRQFLESQLGQVREVLAEGPGPHAGTLQGLSGNYLRVVFPGPAAWRNRLLRVRFLKVAGDGLAGEVVEEK